MAQEKGDKAPRGPSSAVRLDDEMRARIDGLRPLYALPGREPTRSDVLRAVIIAGVEAEEKRMAEGGGK